MEKRTLIVGKHTNEGNKCINETNIVQLGQGMLTRTNGNTDEKHFSWLKCRNLLKDL